MRPGCRQLVAATSKKGVAALEIMRHCQISYKSALFLMNRIRFSLAPDPNGKKLRGTIEADEMYVGGKPRLHWDEQARTRYREDSRVRGG